MNLQQTVNQALASYKSGNFAEAERLCLQVLDVDPKRFTPRHVLGIIRAQQGSNAEALELIGAALTINPNSVAARVNYGNVLKALARFDDALRSYDDVLAIDPDHADALYNRANLLRDTKRHEEALASFNKTLEAKPGHAAAAYNRANLLRDLERNEAALVSYNLALSLKPDLVDALVNRGITFAQMKRFGEALESYDSALALKPDLLEALVNRGITLAQMRRFGEALASFDKALAIKPDYAEAMNGRARTLCESDRIEEGLVQFARSAALVYGTLATVPRSNEPVPPHKARHDREQHDYMFGGGDDNSAIDFRLRLDGGERLATPAINSANAVDAAAQWLSNRPQVVVIDNFLTDLALTELRRFCLGSKVWRKSYKNGYLGAIPEYGFACPLLAQIAQELRGTFPVILSGHPLVQLWGFKYDSQLNGIDIHADEAAVNVNFWITPDDANLDPEHGGLVVWDVAAPLDWNFAKFNGDSRAARDFLSQSGAKPLTVSYRANRAVVFDSDLFHQTDKISFRDGYLNRRINVTLLYGRRAEPQLGTLIGPEQ